MGVIGNCNAIPDIMSTLYMKIWNIVEILSMGIFKSFTDNLFYNWTVNRFFLIDYGFVCINYVHMLD